MALKKVLDEVHAILSANGIDHALIGGFALGAYGVNRATGDIDFLIDENDVERLKEILPKNGYRFEKSSTQEFLHFFGKFYVDFLIARRPASKGMLERAKVYEGIGIKCVGAEDIIGLKIQAYVNNPKRALRDKADIQSLIEHCDKLDWELIKKYADLFDQWNEIQKIKALK